MGRRVLEPAARDARGARRHRGEPGAVSLSIASRAGRQGRGAGQPGHECLPTEAWERAFEVAQEAQRRAEDEQLEQVITVAHKGGAAALGLADTLAALQQGRAYQLLVAPEFHTPGRQCANCGAFVLDDLTSCPYCNGKLVVSTDVVNLAVHRAIDAGLKVSALDRSPRLGEVGGIAAVLRY